MEPVNKQAGHDKCPAGRLSIEMAAVTAYFPRKYNMMGHFSHFLEKNCLAGCPAWKNAVACLLEC